LAQKNLAIITTTRLYKIDWLPHQGYQTTSPPPGGGNIRDNLWSVGERKKSVYNCKD